MHLLNVILKISGFLHFSNNKNKPYKKDENCNWVWKVSTIFDMVVVHMLNTEVQPNMLQLMKLFVSWNSMYKM